MRHVIIGNSAAAVGAVEAIRRHDSTSSITIISDEPHHVYSRPLISYLLGGLVDESHMYYRPPEFYDYQRVEAMLGIEVTGIDTAARIVQLANGEAVPYDRLLIATGGRPFIPPEPAPDWTASSPLPVGKTPVRSNATSPDTTSSPFW